jgi:hypothetical protein
LIGGKASKDISIKLMQKPDVGSQKQFAWRELTGTIGNSGQKRITKANNKIGGVKYLPLV